MAGGAGFAGRSVTSRALAVLGAFDSGHRRLTLSELAARADLPLTTTHRLVKELVDGDALVRRDDGTYVVGSRLWDLGPLATVHVELRQVASPFLQDLFAATRDTVHLAVRDGAQTLYVDRLSGPTAHHRSRQGAPRACAGERRHRGHGPPNPGDPPLGHPAGSAGAGAERGQASRVCPDGGGDVPRHRVRGRADPGPRRPGRGRPRHRRPQLAARPGPGRPRALLVAASGISRRLAT